MWDLKNINMGDLHLSLKNKHPDYRRFTVYEASENALCKGHVIEFFRGNEGLEIQHLESGKFIPELLYRVVYHVNSKSNVVMINDSKYMIDCYISILKEIKGIKLSEPIKKENEQYSVVVKPLDMLGLRKQK